MKKLFFIITSLLLTTLLVFFFSCKKDKEEELNTVSGYIVSENGTESIPGALLFVDDDHDFYYTYADNEGYFELDLPEGTYTLNIQTGGGKIFRSQVEITVEEGKDLQLPAGSLKLHQAANLAYISGLYDNMEAIIIDSLGYTCDELFQSDLDNLTTLTNYQAIFLNCGKTFDLDSLKYENLRLFVERGGSIYASDFSVEYLTGDGYSKSITTHGPVVGGHTKTPCATPLAGGFIPDSVLCTSTTGPATTITNADIIAQDIITLLGKSTIDIEYDLSGWEVISHYESPWEVLIQDATYGALALRMRMPSSYVPPTTGNWITICHIPPGNPSNPITITINQSALSAHLAHGDYIGPCSGTGGTIYYSTFHNHTQGGLSDDVMRILEYYILNL